jgi:hypothetical protein
MGWGIVMKKLLVAAAATAALLVAGAANAAITVKIYHTDPNSSAAAANATIAQAATMVEDATTTVGALNFTNAPGNNSTVSTIGAFLNNPAGLSATVSAFTLNNTYFLFTGSAFLNAGANNLSVAHDDGLQMSFAGIPGFAVNQPGPTAPVTTNFTVTAPSAGTYAFTLAYGETAGGPAVLHLDLNNAPLGGVPEPATWGLMLVGFGGLGAMMRRRRSAALPA